MSKIRNKQLSMKLFDEGYFGNTIKQWYDHNQWLLDSHEATRYVLRQWKRAKGGSGYCKYNLYPVEVVREIQRLRREGYDISTLCISEAMPDHAVILQGEFLPAPPTLFYSTEVMHMRPALKAGGKYAYGPQTYLMLQAAMCVDAYERMMELTDEFPAAVIEFSCYNVPVGTKRWNTMLWEVRNY